MTLNLERNVLAALDAVVQQDRGRTGLIGTYGWIYGEWLANAGACHDQVRRLLFEHAVRNEVISAKEPRLGNKPCPTITMTQAARRWGMGYKRARALAADAGMVPRGSRRSVAFTMDPNAITNLQSVAQNSIYVRDAARSLGTGKKQVADLLAAGLLTREVFGAVSSASITMLIDGLAHQCCAGSPPKGALSISSAARDASVPLWRIVESIHQGTIPCWRESIQGLSQFYIRLCDALMLRAPSRALSVEMAAQRLGVHRDCARAMAKCGTILDTEGIITVEGIDRFKNEFVVGAKVARDLGRSPRSLHRQLIEAGVPPAFDLKSHRQAIYRRIDIASLGLIS